MEQLFRSLRYSIRIVRSTPGFSAVVLLTLALGIGANTSIFSIANALFLAPLPFPDADELVQVFSTKDGHRVGPSRADADDFVEQNRTFQGLVAFDSWRKNVSGMGDSNAPEEMMVGLAAPQYFEVLGIRPLMGRIFSDEENHYGKHYEVLINESFWRTRLGANRDVLGQTLKINDEPYRIIGVLPDVVPEWMNSGRRILVWTPEMFRPPRTATEQDRQARGWYVIGRLKRGVTRDQAEADLARTAAILEQQHPLDRGYSVAVRSLAEARVGSLNRAIWLLMGAVSFVLLIACSNIANLFMARNTARRREFALRSALGASRFTLVRQLVEEALVLSFLGGVAGLGLGWLASTALARVHPVGLPQLATATIDWRVMLFTLAVAVLTGLSFGLVPAFTGSSVSLVEVLKEASPASSPSGRSQFLRRLIVVTEIAFSLILVIGAGLLVKSLIRLQGQQTGFSEDHLLKAHLFLPAVRYSDSTKITEFCDRLTTALSAIPGIRQATVATAYPPSNRWTQNLTIPGRPVSRQEDIPVARFLLTDANYLQTLHIPLLRGRDFTDSDKDTGPPVVLVNQEFARQYFPNEDPLGRRIQLAGSEVTSGAGSGTWLTIVGVIGNTKNRGLSLSPDPETVGLYRQIPPLNFGFKDVVVRTTTDPYQMADTIARRLHQLDPDLPLAEVSSMQDYMETYTQSARFIARLLSLFAVLGFALAVVGVYGVISCLVAQRMFEIGVRMALGAQRQNILWLVLRQGLSLAIIGIVLGIYGAWQVRMAMQSLLWGISAADTSTLLTASVGLLAVAALATFIPAVRAMRIDPLLVLRAQ